MLVRKCVTRAQQPSSLLPATYLFLKRKKKNHKYFLNFFSLSSHFRQCGILSANEGYIVADMYQLQSLEMLHGGEHSHVRDV